MNTHRRKLVSTNHARPHAGDELLTVGTRRQGFQADRWVRCLPPAEVIVGPCRIGA
jgi:hypothetical protein